LARHLSALIADQFETRLIVRHQLLSDPRIRCTNKNGCAAILVDPIGQPSLPDLRRTLKEAVVKWAPEGSDPGLAVAANVPEAVMEFGRRCQREMVTQREARQLAAGYGIYLEGLGGTEDGVIGAMAALGLVASKNDGRVIQRGGADEDAFNISGEQAISSVYQLGIDQVLCHVTGKSVREGTVELGKRLRPNLRGGKVVLYVEPSPSVHATAWTAVRLT
jgi:hypothetical protein